MADDQQLLWTTKGQKPTAFKDHLNPHSMYDFFNNSNATGVSQRKLTQRITSAAPRIGGNVRDADISDSSVKSLTGSRTSVRNPSPTPVTSRPLSSRSGASSVSSQSVWKTRPSSSLSPTSLYLRSHTARCKSAPPRSSDYYLPRRPKTAKCHNRSATSPSGSAPKRAWQNRTSSAKSQHSLLSREEVNKRHKERCKSAPLPYDFSSIEVVSSVPEQGSDIQRLKAFTRPLTCMPNVVQNVLSHNGLRHCCSAYQPRPKSVCSSRQQFWPVARPAVFHRGDVPKYLHFVKPVGFSSIKGAQVYPRTPTGGQSIISDYPGIQLQGEDDEEETVLYEEQFVIPATPSEASLSDGEEHEDSREERQKFVDNWQVELDVDGNTAEDLGGNYVGEYADDKDQKFTISDCVASDATPEQAREDFPFDKQDSEFANLDQGIEVIITEVEVSPTQSPYPEETEQESDAQFSSDQQESDLQIVVPEIPQWAAQEEVSPVKGQQNDREPSEGDVVPQVDHELRDFVEPVTEVKDNHELLNEFPINKQSKVEVKPQVNQVKFADSLILTSYKPPQPKKEKKDQPVKPVSILKPALAKTEDKVPLSVPGKKTAPVVEHKVPDQLPKVKPLLKPEREVAGKIEKNTGEKPESKVQVAEERAEEPPKLEPDVLPKPEYIRAPGAYRMYNPKDLLDYHLERKREVQPVKKSLSSAAMPQFKPSAESAEVMATVLEEHKQRREGMKPWLQGRLALSKQTSRFELPMDVRLLEAMTPMEYLTKYCIISTRRKALYKHTFQKVDKDRDKVITVKEMDRGLREIHVDCITTDQVKKLIEMVEGNEKSMFNLAQFSAIAAFSERWLFSEIQVTEKNNVYSSKEVIEEADFCGLKYKLSGFPVNPTVRKILEVL